MRRAALMGEHLSKKREMHVRGSIWKKVIMDLVKESTGRDVELSQQPRVTSVLAERHIGMGPDACFVCAERGHRANDCKVPVDGRQCTECGEKPHIARSCVKMHKMCGWCGQRGHAHKKCTMSWWLLSQKSSCFIEF